MQLIVDITILLEAELTKDVEQESYFRCATFSCSALLLHFLNTTYGLTKRVLKPREELVECQYQYSDPLGMSPLRP